MNQSKEEKNKALVLDAFDALFNRRDYGAAERYLSPNYIQHSAHIAPAREGLFSLVESFAARLVADGRLHGSSRMNDLLKLAVEATVD